MPNIIVGKREVIVGDETWTEPDTTAQFWIVRAETPTEFLISIPEVDGTLDP